MTTTSIISRRRLLPVAFAALIAGALALPAAPAAAKDLLVFAAASLKNALDDIDASYKKETGKAVTVSFAASSALAKQVEQGAPADIFISADLDWMDYLAKKNLIKAGTSSNLLGNSIVLVAPADSTVTAKVAPNFALASLLGDGHLAMANVQSVPAGKYGKAALKKLGVWDSVKDRVAQADNVRAALLLVSRGEAPLGIVYKTDVVADPKVKIVDSFPDDSHPPIIYPVAVIAASTNPDAAAYLAYLKSPTAAAAFEKQGFTVLE
jgi:molybdate transport system substrate-binding protein